MEISSSFLKIETKIQNILKIFGNKNEKMFFSKTLPEKKILSFIFNFDDENIKVFYPKNSGCISYEIIQGFQNSLFYSFFYRPFVEEFEIQTDQHIKKNSNKHILEKFIKIE